MMLLVLALVAQADDAAIRAEGWARKAKPVAVCSTTVDCDEKWKRGTDWIRSNSRFQIAVDKSDLFATFGAVYANTDLSFVLTRRVRSDGKTEIAARAWCGNVITCKPKPKDAMASLARVLNQ